MTIRIAVIGAGVAAAAISRRVSSTFPHIELTIFDATHPQRNLAFGHVDNRLLCNTSTSVMSLDVEKPYDFAEFLGYDKPESSSVFSSREEYGSYLQQALPSESGRSDGQLQYIPDEVIRVEDSSAPVVIHTARHGLFKADFVIITGGRKTARIPSSCRSYRDSVPVFPSPYDPGFSRWLENHPSSRVGILGTGLSAVDAARLALLEGLEAVMLSPSGQLPGVRTSLQLNAPREMPAEEFRAHSRNVEDFRQYATQHATFLGWHPRRLREPLHMSGTDRFLLDYELAKNGYSVWEK